MLIDDRLPPPSRPERPVWEPDLRTCAWVLIALASMVACLVTDGFTSFVLLCLAIGSGAQAITRALPYGDGLREHRQ